MPGQVDVEVMHDDLPLFTDAVRALLCGEDARAWEGSVVVLLLGVEVRRVGECDSYLGLRLRVLSHTSGFREVAGLDRMEHASVRSHILQWDAHYATLVWTHVDEIHGLLRALGHAGAFPITLDEVALLLSHSVGAELRMVQVRCPLCKGLPFPMPLMRAWLPAQEAG